MIKDIERVKSQVVVKTLRNIRRGTEADEEGRGLFAPEIRLDLERARLMTESYKATEGEPMVIRRAKALARILQNMTICIQDWERIVGNYAVSPNALMFPIELYWKWVDRIVHTEEGRTLLDDQGRAELKELTHYWKGKTTRDLQERAFSGSPDLETYWKYEGTFLWAHFYELGLPNFDKLLKVGLKGIVEEAEARLEEITKTIPPDYLDQKDFLEAVVISLKAAIAFAQRYAGKARELAEKENSQERRKELEEIARTCEWVPANPPRTLQEALQCFWFVHMIKSQIELVTNGIGVRFDLLFNPFYQRDKKEGRITREEALDLLRLLWLKFEELGMIYSPLMSGVYGGIETLSAMTIGGVDSEGRDVTNEMTYLVLDAALAMRTSQPSLTLRVHDGTPRELLLKAIDVIRTGIGYPSLFNDKSLIPLLLRWDVPIDDARNYSIEGCVYPSIMGKNMVRRSPGYLVLPKCLWWALHQGVNPKTGEQYGAPTPDPAAFTCIEDVMEAYLEQVRFFVSKQIQLEHVLRRVYEESVPRPFLSALIDGCIERGQDFRKWTYPSPTSDFVIFIGPTNVADSLAAIKTFVFDEKKFSLRELIDTLDRNWEGSEDLRQMMLTRSPRYGNDNDYVDMLAREVHHRTEQVVEGFTNNYGIHYSGNGSGASSTYGLSFHTPATPDGRKDGEPFSDATLSPCPGADSKGPTAVLMSCSKIDTIKTNFQLLNQKFLPQFLEGEYRETFLSYLKTWLDLGIAHVQFNVVNKATLLDAQQHPEKHRNLLVRVAGYSAYFVELSKGLQDHIIARTELAFD